MLATAAASFLDAITGEVSPHTVDWYRRSLAPLVAAMGSLPVAAITVTHVRAWRRDLLSRQPPYSARTVHGFMRAARRLFNWLVDERQIPASPMARVRLPKLPAEPPKAITERDFVALLDAAWRPRDRAILLFLADTGCRVGGLVSLTVDDLELDHEQRRGRARVVEKGRPSRWVQFGTVTYAALIVYLWTDAPTGALWVGLRGPLTRYGVNQLLTRLARSAGVSGRVNPHSFRHRFARVWLERGGSLPMLAQALGHADTQVTAAYYARWSADEIAEWHRRIDPAFSPSSKQDS